VGDFSIAMFLGGIAVFIFGMSLLEDSLKILAGRSFKKFLQQQTENKFRAIIAGIAVTGVLQGSSVVMLMVLSFVGAGIMSLRNALAVMLGSNLGSTLNNWIVAWVGFKLNLETFSYPLLALALIGFLFKSPKVKAFTNFLFGFALLFIGLEWMKSSVFQLVQNFDLSPYLSYHPYWFIIIGFLVTSMVQSSSVTVAISLSALYGKAISFEVAACLVLGAELGTTLKLIIGSTGGIPDKKRLALGNFIFNLVSLLLAASFLWPLIDLVLVVMNVKDPLIGLVLFQSLINVMGIIVFYPLLGLFANFLDKRYRAEGDEQITKYLKTSAHPFVEEALPLARQETMRLFLHTLDFNREVLGIGQKTSTNKPWTDNLRALAKSFGSRKDSYKSLKMLQGEILEYLAELNSKEMNEVEIEYSANLLTVSRDIIHAAKNVKDIAHNWNDINASSNDALHGLYQQTKSEEIKIFDELQRLLVGGDGTLLQEKLDSLLEDNRNRHKKIIEEVMRLLKSDRISELDASTLLNLFREFYSCHKALISSLTALHALPSKF
jgi:phosphate:Na+ symporter